MTEAAWFTEQLAAQGIQHVVGVANRVHPAFGPGTAAKAREQEAAAEADGDGRRAALWRNVAELRALAESARKELEPFAELLGKPLVAVPLLSEDVHDIETLGEVRRWMFPD